MPRLLDLFCGAGGAAMGYYRAGFEVIGVDLDEHPRFPFKFIQGDALEFPLEGYDAIHASPPCQDYSRAMKHLASGYPRLIDPIRERLKATGVPWVIENVPGSPLPTQDTLLVFEDMPDEHGLLLCGTMFHLQVQRHRLFQTSFPCAPPRLCRHSIRVMNPHNAGARKEWREILGEGVPIERTWRQEMGVGWMNAAEGREAIPPFYTTHIGYSLLKEIEKAT